MNLVITGFMGCGKTMVARELAHRLNLEMVDLDDRITQREGRSPAQLINEEGETTFRSIETETLRELLETETACVISLGGGAWIAERNRALIEQYSCTSVWLDVPFVVCWARIEASNEERPLGKTREEAQARYEQRRPIYALAKIHVQVNAVEQLSGLVSRIQDQLATDFTDEHG
jgi:shikimate kinase